MSNTNSNLVPRVLFPDFGGGQGKALWGRGCSNRTEWSPVRSVNRLSDYQHRGGPIFFIYEYDYRLNWTT